MPHVLSSSAQPRGAHGARSESEWGCVTAQLIHDFCNESAIVEEPQRHSVRLAEIKQHSMQAVAWGPYAAH